MPPAETTKPVSLSTLALLFLRLGSTAFGGPAAHIAMMQTEVVKRRQWMSEQEFLDMVSACNLIPGPNSTEMAIHIGYKQAGLPGLIVAGSCFILPAAAIVIVLAWFYVQYSQMPAVGQMMNGIKPVIVAIILRALMALSMGALKSGFLKVLCLAAFIACFFSGNELIILLLAAVASVVWAWCRQGKQIGRTAHVLAVLAGLTALSAAVLFFGNAQIPAGEPAPFSLQKLFLYFVKIGSVLYGSGYVLLAFLRADLVEHWHWLTSAQLLDATAIGQVTPGPVFTTATFIGYLLGGLPGALVATAGIFLPAFIFVAITAPLMSKLRASKLASAALDGINASSLALMAFVTFALGKVALAMPVYAAEAALAAFLLWRFDVNPTWVIVAGAAVGLLLQIP